MVSLEKGKTENYACSIKLLLNKDKGEELQAVDGEIHIIGHC